jgi:hypothetical protein
MSLLRNTGMAKYSRTPGLEPPPELKGDARKTWRRKNDPLYNAAHKKYLAEKVAWYRVEGKHKNNATVAKELEQLLQIGEIPKKVAMVKCLMCCK